MHDWQDSLVDKDTILRGMLSRNSWGVYFGVPQHVVDTVWERLTNPDGNSAIYVSMEIGADLDVFNPVGDKLVATDINDSKDPELNAFIQRHLRGPLKIPNYSGGLGVLAGDTLKSFAACRIPVVAISLMYRKGYFEQLVDSRLGQVVWSKQWRPETTPSLYRLNHPLYPDKPLQIELPFFDEHNRAVMTYAQLWLKLEANENLDYFVPHILLDFGVADSPDWIREAANSLYDSSSERVKAIQRRMLGAGVMPTMDILGLTAKTIHLNEQHGVVAVLHLIADTLLKKFGQDYHRLASDQDILDATAEVSQMIIYTIHTPVKAGHDRFNRGVYAALSHETCQRILNLLARDLDQSDTYNFTSLAMQVNRAVNSVSRLHRDVTQKQFSQFAHKITAITNGVHHLSWISKHKAEAFAAIPELVGWRQDPSIFSKTADLIYNKKFRSYIEYAWARDNEMLIEYVNNMLSQHRLQSKETWIDPPNYLSYLDDSSSRLQPAVMTIGFARRFSTYKRADLIFDDIDQLAEIIVSRNQPINFIFAGKAHPSDEPGKALIKSILDIQESLFQKSNGLAKLVFIPDYDMSIARLMVAGVHAWLNSPKRPLEASGTSGMKAAMNGVPNVSIMDGWWIEGFHDGKTGWKFGYEQPLDPEHFSEDPDSLRYDEDSASFYKLLPEILQEFYDPALRPKLIDKCIMNLTLNIPIFNTHRVVAEYCDRYQLDLPSPVEKRMRALRKLYRSEPGT